MFSGFSQTKCKTQCQLLAGRIRLMRNKRQIQLKQSRRQVADLLRSGKSENARIRVESVMREEQMLQAYEVIELFVELLTVRIQLIEKSKEIPGDMIEAVSSLVYAAQRITDLPELQAIRGMLGSKYGKEYIAEASSDTYCRKWHVNENLVRCLAIDAPAAEDKLACLSEIAQENGVEWDAAGAAAEMLPSRRTTPYLAGDRTSYSDPRTNGPAPPYPSPPPTGGGGGGYGGGFGAGGPGGGSGGYYGSHGGSPGVRHTAADIAEFAAGPRSKAEEAEGIVHYPAATAPPSEQPSAADGVVDYPAVSGGGAAAEQPPQKDLTGPDGLGDPSDWDPPPREIPYGAGPRGGALPAKAQRQPAKEPPRRMTGEPKPYAASQQPPAPADRPVPRISILPPAAPTQPTGGSPGGLSVSPNSRWAPPPGGCKMGAEPGHDLLLFTQRRDMGGHLDAVARWKYQREHPGASRPITPPAQRPGGGGTAQPWGGAGPAGGTPGGGGATGAAPSHERSHVERQADFDAAPGGPPAKEHRRPGPPSAPPPPPQEDLSLPTPPRTSSPAPPPSELDDLQKRFEALKRR